MLINTIKSIFILLSGLIKECISFFSFISANFVCFLFFLYLPDLDKMTPEKHYEFTALFLKNIAKIIEVHGYVYIIGMFVISILLRQFPHLVRAFARIYGLWRKQPLASHDVQA